MQYLVGQETCSVCGETTLVVRDRNAELTVGTNTCSRCGVVTPDVPVWHSANIWPEVEALVKFDVERTKLNLPAITNDPWQ
jgi:transcription elongation factor Elf1